MPFTVTTSNSNIILSNETTYWKALIDVQSRNTNNAVIYVSYTKGTESYVRMKTGRKKTSVHATTFFFEPQIDTDGITLVPFEVQMSASYDFCFPMVFSIDEDVFRIDLTPDSMATTGSLVLDINFDQYYPNTH